MSTVAGCGVDMAFDTSWFLFRAYNGSALPTCYTMNTFHRSLTACCFVAACLVSSSDGLAISSSKSSKKKLLTNARQGGSGGFGTAQPALVHIPDTSNESQNLINFLLNQKSKGINGETQIGFNADTGIRGLYACKNMKKGEIICKIPSDCALALSDPGMGGDDVPTIAHEGRNFLLMYQQELNAQMLWAPYLDTLPSRNDASFDPSPDFWSDEEIEQLEFPRAVTGAKERKSEIAAVAGTEEDMSFDDLQFATWIVSSRSFQIQMSGSNDSSGDPGAVDDKGRAIARPHKSIRVLLPYLDMANHDSDNANAELHLIDPEKDDAWFAIRATRPIAAGKEITLSYGSGIDSSVELLLKYGFVPSENKIDAIMLERSIEGSIETLDGWKTTLEEDLEAVKTAEGSMKSILQLRIKLKQAY